MPYSVAEPADHIVAVANAEGHPLVGEAERDLVEVLAEQIAAAQGARPRIRRTEKQNFITDCI